MSLRNLLVSRCNIQAETESKDAKGHVTVTWANVVTRMRCRFNPLRGTEHLKHKGAGRETTHRFYCETRISTGGGVKAASSATTIPDLIKGTQASQNPRHRIVAVLAGTKRYFQIEAPTDTDEIQFLTVIDLIERDSAYPNA